MQHEDAHKAIVFVPTPEIEPEPEVIVAPAVGPVIEVEPEVDRLPPPRLPRVWPVPEPEIRENLFEKEVTISSLTAGFFRAASPLRKIK